MKLLYCVWLVLLLAVEAGAGVVTGPIKTGPGVHPNNVGKCWEFDTDRPEAREVPCSIVMPTPYDPGPIDYHQSPWYGACTSPVINQRCWLYTDKVLGPQITIRDDHDVTCLAQMEAAMRAMEPFLDHWTYNEDGSITTTLNAPVQVPIMSTDQNDPRMKKMLKERNEKHGKALEQWDAAKACWRTP